MTTWWAPAPSRDVQPIRSLLPSLSIRCDESIRVRLKVAAAYRHCTVQDLVLEALTAWFEREGIP